MANTSGGAHNRATARKTHTFRVCLAFAPNQRCDTSISVPLDSKASIRLRNKERRQMCLLQRRCSHLTGSRIRTMRIAAGPHPAAETRPIATCSLPSIKPCSSALATCFAYGRSRCLCYGHIYCERIVVVRQGLVPAAEVHIMLQLAPVSLSLTSSPSLSRFISTASSMAVAHNQRSVLYCTALHCTVPYTVV